MSENDEQIGKRGNTNFSVEDLHRCTRRQGLERDEPSIPVEVLSRSELQSVVRSQAASSIDVDFLLIREQCNRFLSHGPVQEFFSDYQCELYSTSYKDKVYSKSSKLTLCIGRVGDYKIGFAMNCVSDNYSIENSDTESTSRNTIQSDTVTTVSMINEFLRLAVQKLTKTFSFRVLAGILMDVFGDAVIVIYRFGQKIPLADIKPKIVAMISDCGLPIEIALGNQFKIENEFLSAYYTPSLKNYSYSNLLSNEMCNAHITNDLVAQTYHNLCFRLSLYNTWQHFKKDVNIVLQRSKNASDCSLTNFAESFYTNDDKLKILLQKINLSELRLEMYFSIGDLVQFREAISAIKITINRFSIGRCNVERIRSTFISYRKLCKLLYSHCQSCEDSTAFAFLFYYWKFHSFTFSTQKMNEKFLNNNVGLYLKHGYFKVNELEMTVDLFNNVSLPQIFSMLKDIFGNSKKSNVLCTYYLYQYCLYFNRQVERENVLCKFIAEKLGILIIELNPIASEKLSNRKTFESFHVLFQALLTKYSKNQYVKAIIGYILDTSIVTNQISKRLNEYLLANEFKLLFKDIIYVLGDSLNSDIKVEYKSVVLMCKSFSFVEFSILYQKNQSCRTSSEDAFVRTFDRLFKFFKSKMNKFSEHFFNVGDFILQKRYLFDVEKEIFMRLLFFSFPTGERININSILLKLIDLYTFIEPFLRFIYVTISKYYLPHDNDSERIYKFTSNFGSGRKATWRSNQCFKGLTFNRIIYFSGLFDRRCHDEGIYLPIDGRLYLQSRYLKIPHNIVDTIEGLLYPNNICFHEKNKPADILEMFGTDISDSDENEELSRQITNRNESSENESLENLPHMSEYVAREQLENVLEDVPSIIPSVGPSSVEPMLKPDEPTKNIVMNDEIETNENSTIRSRLEEVFPLPNQKRFIDSLIENNITEDILAETDENGLVEYFTDLCGFTKIIATSIAAQLKKRFRK